MAKTCGVLDPSQKETDHPSKRIRCSGAQSLVNQGKAKWILRKKLLRMLDEDESLPPKAEPSKRFQCGPRAYIPKTMPPHEISGLEFDDPIKNQISLRIFRVRAANHLAAVGVIS